MKIRSIVLFLYYVGCVQMLGAQHNRFISVPSSYSGITFSNDINENEEVNILQYDYLYNGAGVGVGDFNHDNLPDLFFAGNMVNDQLYFNRGKLTFENVSSKAGITHEGWSTGVCVFDVNNDGWDDIYVCRSGPEKYDAERRNILYVNNQDGTFTEKAEEYGLDLSGHFTQAAPLDIDLDGDLDLYVMGHPGKFKHKDNFQEFIRDIQSGKIEHDYLLENVGDKYVDITESAGIFEFGYGLGLAISDINRDGYPDILVCNDFDEPDHLFINQQNNTFKDEILSYFKHTSNYSMGNDVGDINNDGLFDFISVDMAFESHERSKMNMASMSPERFFTRVRLGWGYQYMHNMLQLNTGMGSFQEIAHFAGVAKTDWSWAPLLFDIDKDGYQDLFVSNGYKRDTKNNDIGYLLEKEKEKKGNLTIQEFLKLIPQVKIENYFFRNNGHLIFEDARIDWGVDERLNSNGAAYADLDNDGDLDLILNNIDTLASIYNNKSNPAENSIELRLSRVPQGQLHGCIFEAVMENGSQFREAYFVRGYCSTVEKRIFFYSKEGNPFKHIVLHQPNGKKRKISITKSAYNIINLREDLGYPEIEYSSEEKLNYFKDVTSEYKLDVSYEENVFNDFERESLLPHQLSTQGPALGIGDFDKNGLEDIIVTSAVGKIPIVLLQNPNGTFKQFLSRSFYNHHSTEDGGVYVFDVNGDDNLDLFISSGGYQWPQGDTALENRLYIGNGIGMFGFVNNALPPKEYTNSGKVIGDDIDQDGDIDFLVCGNAYPGKYPYAGVTKILINEKGFFKDRTQQIAPQLERIGMVNDACFSDLDYDGDKDLIVVGEWMQIEWFENRNGAFVHWKNNIGWPGWWTSIHATDIDGDGDDDYILGNAGLNNKFKPSKEHPLSIYANDFDDNGTLDIVLSYLKDDKNLPVRGRECSSGQMPFILEKFPTFQSFANSDLEQIYSKEKLDQSLHYSVSEFRSGIMYNKGDQGLDFVPFPDEAQFSFLNDFVITDLNKDGLIDIIGVGNRYHSEVETTRYDAGCGVVLIQNSEGKFNYVPPRNSGFYVPHNAKSIELISLGKDQRRGVVVGNNGERLQLFEIQ